MPKYCSIVFITGRGSFNICDQNAFRIKYFLIYIVLSNRIKIGRRKYGLVPAESFQYRNFPASNKYYNMLYLLQPVLCLI